MERPEQLDDTINQALKLAYFIHGDKALAMETVINALNKLEVAVQAQDKRLYYEPQGRTTSRKARNKISFGEKHLLQRLIYLESEPFEKEKERSRTLSEEDMITHFIKHLIKITLKRNSFYVALGISRLLHNYSTAETMEIYNLVVQDPERVRDDYYYRSRKSRLMQEMKERFGNLLKVTKVNRGEERFEANGASAQYSNFVFDCLNQFTPWATACVIPTGFNPFSETVQDLAFDHPDPDAEHQIEVNRTHSIMHPDCFTRLLKALKFSPPIERLEIPNFFLAKSQDTNHRNQPPGFRQDEIETIKARLGEQSAQRKRFAAGLLKIRVDGIELAEIDLKRTSQVHFNLDEGAELIEVIGKTTKRELLLASCFVTDHTQGNSKRILLEGGQELTFNLAPRTDRYGEIEETAVEIGYRETRALRAAVITLKQRINGFGEGLRIDNLAGTLKPALTLTLVALLVIGVWFFAGRSKRLAGEQANTHPMATGAEENPLEPQTTRPTQPQQDNIAAEPTPESSKPDAPRQVVEKPSERNRPTQPEELIAKGNRKTNPEDADALRTRGNSRAFTGLALPAVKSIAIQLSCEAAVCQQLKVSLIQALSASGRFTFTNDFEAADALLKISDTRETKTASETSIIARLANASGYVLFPANRRGSGAKYLGSPTKVAEKLVKDLLEETRKNPTPSPNAKQ